MKKHLEKFVLFLHKKYKITPDILTYIRIFSAPWIALLISKVLSGKSLSLSIITIVIYILVVSTDLLDGILARAISKTNEHDHAHGGMLDRIADKILIITLLIPFGLNLFTFLIILAESILLFHVLFAPSEEKQAHKAGKIKMILQTILIPILILNTTINIAPEMLVYIYIIITIIASFVSVYSHYSHYFYIKND
ncbi:MAG: CDP-alcohol phosphatidyltransferase family protein [Burkholderiales bacterium]|nr:CDP-alcohol phosphatidyltransferase family protein [Burkholderiales bacterium]